MVFHLDHGPIGTVQDELEDAVPFGDQRFLSDPMAIGIYSIGEKSSGATHRTRSVREPIVILGSIHSRKQLRLKPRKKN
jgi:hypothetical protein